VTATDTTDIAAGRAGPTRPALRWALAALCVTQITSWGVLYYAFPVMLESIIASTGWSATAATGAFSAGLGVCAVAGIPVGRLLDRVGPGPVMTAGSVLGVLSVLGIAVADALVWFTVAWVVAGVAQAAVLYPPAFAALTHWHWPDHVRAITILTLAAGLASTVFAPLTAGLLQHMSWRSVYLVLAGVLAVVTIPLHASLVRVPWRPERGSGRAGTAADRHVAAPYGARNGSPAAGRRPVLASSGFLLLTGAFGLSAFGLFAAVVFLVPLLTDRGMTTTMAAWALGLSGAGQLLGRLGYRWLVGRSTVRGRTVGILLAGAVTTAVVGIVPGPASLLISVAVLAGAARGLFTLLSATAVSDRWGSHRFGTRNGVFHAPVTAVMAVAPWAGALLAERAGGYPAMFLVLGAIMLVAAAVSFLAPSGPTDVGHTPPTRLWRR
jgi:MFS family permease